jgi:hypothetical protein
MTPAEYLAEILLPTAIEFRDERRSRRRAYLACIAAFHMKDYLRRAGAKGVEDAVREACISNGDFDLVRDVCNGAKHLEATRFGLLPFRAGSDYERPPFRAGELECGISMVGDVLGGREVQTPRGRFDLFHAVRNVLLAYEKAFPSHLKGCDFGALREPPRSPASPPRA